MNDEWISVDERLPDDYEEVLIWYTYVRHGDFDDDYTTYAIAYYVHGYERWFGVDPLGTYPRIKYWMPLPKPPGSTEKKCEEKMIRHGKWKEERRKADGIFDLYQGYIICSICGNEHYYGTGDKPNYCDNCGAKMDLEK